MARRLLVVLGILALVGGLWSTAGSGFLAAQVPSLGSGSPAASPGASPVASPRASPTSAPVGKAPIDPGQATVAALSTELASISLTATADAIPPAAPEPTATPPPAPTPTATPTPPPQPGDTLYDAGDFAGWSTTADWKSVGNMVVNDGTGDGEQPLLAPYQLEDITDYAIEAEIQVLGVNSESCWPYSFGVVGRVDDVGGYFAGVALPPGACPGKQAGLWYLEDVWHDSGAQEDEALAAQVFDPGQDWHTYRLEMQGNSLRLLIDGSIVLELADNRYLSPGEVGLWSDTVQVNVRSFKVIAL